MSDKVARSIGSATICFGMVSCPIKVYSVIQDTAIHFNFLHKNCGSRLRQHYTCLDDGKVVERDDMVKGFEHMKNKYVQFTADEIKALEEKSSYTIDIVEFIPLDKIDPIYFDKPYYLAPDKGGKRSYSLLVEAFKRSGKAGIAHYASKGKSYVVVLRSVNNGIVMNTLHYTDEVRSIKEIPLEPIETKEVEVNLALQLVNNLSQPDFQPDKYKDDVKERIQAAIDQKIAGQEVELIKVPNVPQIIDLMEALKASLMLAAPNKA